MLKTFQKVEQKYAGVRNEVPAIFIRMYSDKHKKNSTYRSQDFPAQ